jgi:hypothetical protein
VKLEADIEENVKAITAVEDELVALGKKLAPLEEKEELNTLKEPEERRLAALRDDKKQLRKKEEQLRKKEEQLRKKEEQLRKKEEQLREKELLLLRHREDAGGPSKLSMLLLARLTSLKATFTVTLRPWVGYEEVDPVVVNVDSMETLFGEARKVVVAEAQHAVKLYYAELNEAGLPVNKEARTQLSNVATIGDAIRKGDGVVWICVGGSPTSSPQKQKSQSPFLVGKFSGVGFVDLPELFDDYALSSLTVALGARAQDPELLLMMAIPGSGKSRTVMSACQQKGLQQVRVKVLESSPEHEKILAAIRIARAKDVMSYEDWRSALIPPIREILLKSLVKGPCVLHIDDIQTLMGTEIVTRKEWNDPKREKKRDPWDLVMPTTCSVLQAELTARPDLWCVLTGTNFFAPLVVSVGSEAKTKHILIDGTFEPQWVMKNLVKKYFNIPDALSIAMLEHVTFLSGNRRAIQHFFVELKRIVERKRDGDELLPSELLAVRVGAFAKWSGPINKALGERASGVAIMAVAALLFPDGLGGQRGSDSSIVFPFGNLPAAVREFGLAGGLNVTLSEDMKTISLLVPRGCVWEYISTLVSASSAHSNVEEVNAFVRVAQSVETEKGHAFERLLACELSMVGSEGSCPLYRWLASRWIGGGNLVPDPLVFGQPFVYESRIRDIAWRPHQVYCVAELAKDKGKRIVDLGFPVWLVRPNGDREQKKVMCELKKGYDVAKLWRLCWKYFSEMRDVVAKNPDILVCFVASISFCDSAQPEQKSVQSGESAHDSWQRCHDLIKQDARFLILDNMVAHSRFPLADIFGAVADAGVASVVDGVERMYVGTPAKK